MSAKLPLSISIFALVVIIATGFWLTKLSLIDQDSAKWVLSAQSQATAAILGLMIAAGIFRWRTFTDREEQLQSALSNYLKRMNELTISGSTLQVPIRVFDVMYDDYVKFINQHVNSKGVPIISSEALKILGRLWSLRLLSNYYGSLNIIPARRLTRGALKRLLKSSRQYAIEMWEFYYTNPASFYVYMEETLIHFRAIIILCRACCITPS